MSEKLIKATAVVSSMTLISRIFGLALGTVILPGLAKYHAVEDPAAFSNALDWGLRLVLLVGTPVTIGLLLLAEPMISTLIQYNEFSVRDVHFAGHSLRAYSIGLLGYILIRDSL